MPLTQGQYGGQLTPAVTSGGGAALASGLGSAALGMLTGGGSIAMEAAMKAAGDSSTTVQQPESTIGPQSTGSKVFNLAPASSAMDYNPFWQSITGTKAASGSLIVPAIVILLLIVTAFFLFRRK